MAQSMACERPHPLVLFCDLGNVVVFFDRARSYAKLADYTDLSLGEIEDRIAASGIAYAYEAGRLNDGQFLKGLARLLGLPADQGFRSRLADAWADMFWLNPAIKNSLAMLNRLGVQMVILSNTNPIHYHHICNRFPSVMGRFQDKVLSYEVGTMKPDPAIFQYARRVADGLTGAGGSRDLLYIDDLPENITAAAECGFVGHVYQAHDCFEKWIGQYVNPAQ